jgi:hypothetical protein
MSYKSFILGLSMSLFVLTGCVSEDASVLDVGQGANSNAAQDPSPYGLAGDKAITQFPDTRPATGYKVVVVDPNIPGWAAYDADGNLVKTGRASAGSDYCSDEKEACRTVTGTFKVYSKGGADCKSSTFPLNTHGGAPMPYCMHFYKGYAMHGSNEMADYDASHGCVRMVPSSAKWLNENFVEVGTTVIILPYNKPDAYGVTPGTNASGGVQQ